jgi:hypothetical protein
MEETLNGTAGFGKQWATVIFAISAGILPPKDFPSQQFF